MEIVNVKEYLDSRDNEDTLEEQADVIDERVLEIISRVRKSGDEALREYTEQFDQVTIEDFRVSEEEFKEARNAVGEVFLNAIEKAFVRIKRFHEKQVDKSWFYNEADGVTLGQKVTPLDRVGIYVPGGKAAYPSTVLMNVVPAKLAGVNDILITTPPQANGKVNPYVLVAAQVAGVSKVYKVGGAQAIAALAYGTDSIAKVAKIVGPGNAYVACAKKWVYGEVAIDMIAGPSEICVVADESANMSYVAADLLSQAEHDEQAIAVCITTSEHFAKELAIEVEEQKAKLDRKEIIEASLAANGRIILAESLTEALNLVNEIAPEHLQLMIKSPMEYVQYIDHAGAIFLGDHSPEALGDYMAGPNHTLPTSGTATFSSPLGVYDFMKKSSIIHYSKEALRKVSDEIMTIANAEGLSAHAQSIQMRKDE